MTINSPGRFLIQDISGIQCGRIASYNANAEAIYLNRVKNTSVQDVKSYMPLRGSGAGRGLLMTQCFNLETSAMCMSSPTIMSGHTGRR